MLDVVAPDDETEVGVLPLDVDDPNGIPVKEGGDTKELNPAVREEGARDDRMELEATVESLTGGRELDLIAVGLDEGMEMEITVNDAGILDDPRLTGDDDGVRTGVAEATAAEELMITLVDEARAAGDEEDNATDEATTELDSIRAGELDGVLLGVTVTLDRGDELATETELEVDVVHTCVVDWGNWKSSKSRVKADSEQPQTNNRA